MIPNKTYNGLQLRRRYDHIANIGDGSCAAGATKPMGSNRPMQPAVLLTVPSGEELAIDIRLDATDADGKFVKRGKVWAENEKRSGRCLNLGGVLNGRDENGDLEDGFYYVFIGCTTWPADGVVDPDDTHVYISRYFISGGIGSDETRGGAGEHTQPLKYVRPLPGVLMIQNNKIVPFMAIGESHTVTCQYQNAEYRDYKSARVGGVLFDESGVKSYDHDKALVPEDYLSGQGRLSVFEQADDDTKHRAAVGAKLALEEAGIDHIYKPEDIREIHYSLFEVIPQTHKTCEMQIEFEGEGLIYSSVSKNLGQLVAVANGPGVVRYDTNSGSDAAGRGFRLSLLGDVRIKRAYLLASTSQQPM